MFSIFDAKMMERLYNKKNEDIQDRLHHRARHLQET